MDNKTETANHTVKLGDGPCPKIELLVFQTRRMLAIFNLKTMQFNTFVVFFTALPPKSRFAGHQNLRIPATIGRRFLQNAQPE